MDAIKIKVPDAFMIIERMRVFMFVILKLRLATPQAYVAKPKNIQSNRT